MELIDITNQIKKYAVAVFADRYRVTSILMADSVKKPMTLDRGKDGISQGFAIGELLNHIGEMKRLEKRGENLYLTPLSDKYYYILVDDLSIDKLKEMVDSGYKPCVLINTSPGNYQIILKIEKTNISTEVANAVVRKINKQYGDPNLSGVVHPHRVPGLLNQKPKYNQNGSYPVVKLVKSENRQCNKTLALAQKISNEIKDKIEIQPELTIKSNTPVSMAYKKHYDNITNHQTISDYSRLDAMIAIRLRATGHTQSEIENAILQNAPLIGSRNHNWQNYAKHTADYAFGYKGNQEIAKNQNYIKIWQKIEAG